MSDPALKPVKWLRLGEKIKYRLDIDAGEFKGRAGMPWLIMAANPHLSINDLLEVMAHYDYFRTRSWVSRRRWMFSDVRGAGRSRNEDGKEERAFEIMDEYPTVSARQMARILREHGIRRSKDWVLRNRVG